MGDGKEIIDVLCVISRLRAGGVQTFLVNNVEPLLRHGVRLNFAVDTTEEQRYDNYVRSLGCKIYPITGINESKMGFMRDLRKLVKEHPELNIVHCNQNFTNIFAQIALAGLRRPVVSHAHSSYAPSGWGSRVARAIFRSITPLTADAYWGCSADAVEWLVGRRLAKSPKAAIIANAIDTNRWRFRADRRKEVRVGLGVGESTWVWVHTGSFTPVKNHRFLIDLFASYQAANADSHLILCGDGPLRREIEEQINRLSLEGKVTLIGVVDNCEDYLSASDAFIFPSIFEGFALSLLEAGCNGLATTTTTTAVPKDAQLPGVVALEGFDTDKWISTIEQQRKNSTNDRVSGQSMITTAGFDINQAAASLARRYKNLLKIK